MITKQPREITPIGEAKWSHLHTPKPPFVDESGRSKGEAKYMIDVYFSREDAAWLAWATKVMARLKAMPDQIDKRSGDKLRKQNPIKRELDETEQPTGRFYISFKTSDKFKPGVFDKYGAVIPPDVLVGNGSKIRVSYLENSYDAFGGGINFYLNAVQVLELVEYKSQNAQTYGFDVVAAPAGNALDDFDNTPFGDAPPAGHPAVGSGFDDMADDRPFD